MNCNDIKENMFESDSMYISSCPCFLLYDMGFLEKPLEDCIFPIESCTICKKKDIKEVMRKLNLL